MKKNIDILHIYYGSQGNGGLYLHEIYDTLKNAGFNQEILVSYYYPLKYGKRIFFKYSDLSSGATNNHFRLVIRTIEFIYGILYALLYIATKKPKVVNYSLNRPLPLEKYFVRLIKLLGSKVAITCHDVLSVTDDKHQFEKQNNLRREILMQADYLIVHNENSVHDLETAFGINNKNIVLYPFPIMDLLKIKNNKEKNIEKKYDFAIVGHIRKSKGVDLLVKVWKSFHKEYPQAKLLIAGNLPSGIDINFDDVSKYNIDTKFKYLNEDIYFESISEAHTIVMPYRSGTNSGVIFNLVSLPLNIIYSNIPMFTNNPLLYKDGVFDVEDEMSLYHKLKEYYINPKLRYNDNLTKYKEDFDRKVISAYKQMVY